MKNSWFLKKSMKNNFAQVLATFVVKSLALQILVPTK
jgi:hypothetical protein